MINHLVQPVSTFASQVDNLILLVGVLVFFWFFLAEGMFFWLMWRFRAKPGVRALYITGKEKHLKRWITIPHAVIILCDVVIVVAAVKAWYNIKQVMPPADHEIRVIGQQWAWSFVHEGPDGKLGTADDIKTVDDLHVEVDKVYHFELESRDVLHSFAVPVFRLKQDAIPGRTINGWFEATKTGTYDIQCAEICGIGHGLMPARLIVQTPADYAAWVQQAATAMN
jgi:cytochrome c oxidase subunit II